MSNEILLFKTEVGSGMWGMKKPESDTDVIEVYLQPTKDILSGIGTKTKAQNHTYKGNDIIDTQYFELGHLVNLLIKGNINAIWAVTSPVVIMNSVERQELARLVLMNLTKASYASINGMSVSQFNDNEKRPNMPKNKAYKTCLRTLLFGINLFNTGTLKYLPVTHTVTKDEISAAFNRLKESYESTKLINNPDDILYRDFLYTTRMKYL
jgi:predicted nucleotidyltransferase